MTKRKGSGEGRSPSKSVGPEPRPKRAWLSPDWKRPGPPVIPEKVRFGPDYLADLPLWGISWYNPPLSRKLLQALCDWQDEFDDHGIEKWPDDEWNEWFDRGKSLANLVRRELGPSVSLDLAFFIHLDEQAE
jgi:hypothetical protein